VGKGQNSASYSDDTLARLPFAASYLQLVQPRPGHRRSGVRRDESPAGPQDRAHTQLLLQRPRGPRLALCVVQDPRRMAVASSLRPMPGRPGCYAHGPLMGARGSVSLLCSDRGPRPSRAHARRRKCSIRGVRTPFLRCCCTLSLLLLALLPPRSRGGLRAVLYGTGCLLMCARVLCFFGEAHPARTCSIQFVPVTWPSSSTKSVTQRAPSMMAAA
jgi:hypothetical protein